MEPTGIHLWLVLWKAYEAVLKYYDKKSDTAVLKIEDRGGFDFFNLIPRSVHVGERVYAIGNPRGLEQSISARSALNAESTVRRRKCRGWVFAWEYKRAKNGSSPSRSKNSRKCRWRS